MIFLFTGSENMTRCTPTIHCTQQGNQATASCIWTCRIADHVRDIRMAAFKLELGSAVAEEAE